MFVKVATEVCILMMMTLGTVPLIREAFNLILQIRSLTLFLMSDENFLFDSRAEEIRISGVVNYFSGEKAGV